MSVIGVPIKVGHTLKIVLLSHLDPLKVLHEAEGHIVTIETTSGEVFLFI